MSTKPKVRQPQQPKRPKPSKPSKQSRSGQFVTTDGGLVPIEPKNSPANKHLKAVRRQVRDDNYEYFQRKKAVNKIKREKSKLIEKLFIEMERNSYLHSFPDRDMFETVPHGTFNHEIFEYFDHSTNQFIAERKARYFSKGLDPVLHNPHQDGETFHYHLHDLYYLRIKSDCNYLYNLHFTFGQPVDKVTNDPSILEEALKRMSVNGVD